jgi:hypothetical protein
MKNYISDGLVSETILLLDAITQYNCTKIKEIMELRITYGINKQSALLFALQCKWVVQDEGYIRITAAGKNIVDQFDGHSINRKLWQSILHDYILRSSPAWSKRIPAGRKEAYIFMTPDEKRCFIESGLMEKPADIGIVEWWDTLAQSIRNDHQEVLGETGRIGELLTVEYERMRTCLEPEWESIESNMVGYDIISSKERECPEPILIEVKSSKCECPSAEMTISRNEWDVAQSKCNRNKYYFYLWLLGHNNQLAIISAKEIEEHIPQDIGSGKWKKVDIPFSYFASKFQTIHIKID